MESKRSLLLWSPLQPSLQSNGSRYKKALFSFPCLCKFLEKSQKHQSYLLYLSRRLESSERLLALKYIIGSPGDLRSKAEAGRRKGSANVFCEGSD